MGIHDGHRDKMRRRFLATGLEGFAEHEVLELLLFYAIPRQDTNPLAHRLLERYGSLKGVLNAPIEDLRRMKGVGENAAVLLHLLPKVWEKCRAESGGGPVVLNSAERAGAYLLRKFSESAHERVYELCLDGKGKLLVCRQLAEGGTTGAELNIRLLAENAILSCASAVILAHNHPSGVALPSQDDFAATERARAALDAVGVRLTDHIIVADGDFVSMADSGFLDR